MKKLQSIISIATMTMMLAMGVVGLANNVNAQTSNYITANDLGIGYAAPTGLGNRDVRETVASIIKVALGLLGIVAVVIILIGGFTWMTAGGNDERVGQAKKWIFSGVIGLAIILSAYALATWVISSLVSATVEQ
jgi:hypothetical protein